VYIQTHEEKHSLSGVMQFLHLVLSSCLCETFGRS